MKQELEIARELKKVRVLLGELRANGENTSLMYGAQQALVWMMGQGMPPTELCGLIQRVAKALEEVEAE